MIDFAMPDNIIAMPTKSNEWYTPARYVEAARVVMGSIDLDPASNAIANKTVKATTYYTKEQNGLTMPWFGNVWLNPPFGRLQPEKTGSTKSHPTFFIPHLLREYEKGNVEQAMLLLLGLSCFRVWFEPLWKYLVCFQSEHLNFEREDGSNSRYGFGTNFIYLGSNEQRFIDIFSQFGPVARRVSKPKERPVNFSLWEDAV